MNNTVSQLLAELKAFPRREEGLRNIKRFSLEKTTFYRSSDYSHSKRVAWHVSHLALLLQKVHPDINVERTIATALVHDDAELITGDHQAGNKSKMTKEQLAALDDEEYQAIATLATRFPKELGGFVYKELLEDVTTLNSKEAQIAKYLDRLDALGESLHELYAGNVTWTHNVINEFGVIPTPFEFYYDRLPRMVEKYPALATLKNKHTFFQVPELRDWLQVVPTFSPHTKESVAVASGHPQYDEWKKVVLNAGDSEEIENLYTQQEYL